MKVHFGYGNIAETFKLLKKIMILIGPRFAGTHAWSLDSLCTPPFVCGVTGLHYYQSMFC